MRSDLLADRWFQTIHEGSIGVSHRHGRDPQFQVPETLNVILNGARLAHAFQLFPCLFFLRDRRESRCYLLSELPPVRPGCSVACADIGFLCSEPATGPFFQPGASNVNPLVWSARRQLQLVCRFLKPIPHSGKSLACEFCWGLQLHVPTNSSHCRNRPWYRTTSAWGHRRWNPRETC